MPWSDCEDPKPIEVKSKRLILRMAEQFEAEKAKAFYERNKERFADTRATYPDGFFTERYWQQQINRMQMDFADDRSACFFLVDPSDYSKFVGSINFSNFVRGAFQACYLGYSIDTEYEGKGFMTECVADGINFVFDALNMHRIMANYIPENTRSERLLMKLGFEKEGYAKDYLFLNGKWRDHILTSLSNKKWQEH